MERRLFLRGGLALGGLSSAALMASCGPKTGAANASSKTLRLIRSAGLTSLDPIWTTAGATKDYAFLTFDQLVSLDENYAPRPQMAAWSVEDGGHAYLFTLRDGLKWHDGQPVRAQDCVASVKRWAIKDSFGQIMMSAVESIAPVDDKSFRIKLSKPFPLLPNALGKTAGPQCFMMPERMASNDPSVQIKEAIGSGPYRFLKEAWDPGAKAAWARFDGYVPRKEPPNGVAGGHVPVMDRIEWVTISDESTAAATLLNGEADWWEIPPPDLVPKLKADPHIVVESRNKAGAYYMLQFNHLHPPFDNQALRQALAMAIDQVQFMRAAQPDASQISAHPGIYTLGTEYATDAGAELLKVKSIDKAKAAMTAGGYKGEKVVVLASQDAASLANMNLVLEDVLRKIGMNVEFVACDFATMAQRRQSHATVDKGGWSLYLTAWTGNDVLNPAVNPMLRGSGLKGFAGWCTDPKLEKLKSDWVFSADPAEQKRLATAVQVQALQSLPYIPMGAVHSVTAYRDIMTGVFPAPVGLYWNVGKSA
jgi:peptide/nickel transport system substrate-binding protein